MRSALFGANTEVVTRVPGTTALFPHISLLLLCFFSGLLAFAQQARSADAGFVPLEGNALVVFVREPEFSFMDYRRAVLFEVKDGSTDPDAFGVIAAKTIVTHQVNPGKHVFMALSDSTAGFMSADLLAGMTYYVRVVSPEHNRYSFQVVDQQQRASNDFKRLMATLIVRGETKAEAIGWTIRNSVRVKNLQSQEYPLWVRKAGTDKTHLRADDGVSEGPVRPAGGGSGGAAVEATARQPSSGGGASVQTQPTVQTAEEKLRELKRLNDAGLISKEVYLEQQRGILSKP
jgi:hypothetical protein